MGSPILMRMFREFCDGQLMLSSPPFSLSFRVDYAFTRFLPPVGCHTWRATGITIYLENDGRLKHAQQMAGHESPRTTKLYDRTKDEITLSEVERIRL